MLSRLLIFSAIAIFLFVSASFAGMNVFSEDLFAGVVPPPRLLEPCGETADISGKKELIFKWSPHEGDISQRKYYDFRLYEGYKSLGPYLILKKEVSPNKHQIGVESSLLKVGAIYTWTLRQKYRSGKSRRSTNSFKVIKK
ncbi:MAG: hypothetical protein RAP41_06030 [Candidatus Orphnella occulta]|nr:hypothetical protein [Candidatus Orphnella occulta]